MMVEKVRHERHLDLRLLAQRGEEPDPKDVIILAIARMV
jgi:hypothetical protein